MLKIAPDAVDDGVGCVFWSDGHVTGNLTACTDYSPPAPPFLNFL